MSDYPTSPMGDLDRDERRRLAKEARALKPSVHVGLRGLTDPIVAQVRQALSKHHLIKIKVRADHGSEADVIGEELSRRVPCHVVDRIGKTLVVHVPDADEARVADRADQG